MTNGKRRLMKEQSKGKIKYEQEQGYPSFRAEIAKGLEKKNYADSAQNKEQEIVLKKSSRPLSIQKRFVNYDVNKLEEKIKKEKDEKNNLDYL